ncbi:TetR/AcrR family transcriptional regulator [Acidaminobacter sp. JC074]|uniref:TetR/AcrR family transcriptional regulator n=1 Tax=Acidaminobacter sp. JC074 TaxID=2530199 RepID=UPI001F1044A6|nr:TetR/AcrR family transcriptional regulator [Acidaminobacter sp. JC074]MCH4891249.1 TetR/AcrR family transcriptional regulator [Acidaminobacter sp. JC074]
MNKNDIVMARSILTLFTKLGFKKTTMQDIANVTGLSRQSVYKKYGSKSACYEWTVNMYLTDIYMRMFEVMNKNEGDVLNVLHEVFRIFIGEAVEIVNHNHGTEVLDVVLKATFSSEEDWHVRFTNRLAQFLDKNKCVSKEKAFGVSITLISASKGLLLVEPTEEQFRFDMDIIFRSVLNLE